MSVNPSADNLTRQAYLQGLIDDLLESLTPGTRQAVYRCAVPHWVDAALLVHLDGEGQLSLALPLLLEYQFIQYDSLARLRYLGEVRKLLLTRLRREAPGEYLEANRVAYNYFIGLATDGKAQALPGLEREALYHLLVLDESAGLRLLNEKLEEGGYYRQLGTVEQLVDQAGQLRGQLSENGLRWLSYFEGCLDLLYGKNQSGEVNFEQLVRSSTGTILGALAGWKLGVALVARQQWSSAIRLMKDSLDIIAKTDETTYQARVLMSLGEAYCDLAERSGGTDLGVVDHHGKVRRLFVFLQHMPFLILEWLVRRISVLPSLYFGTNYQDWIIDRLMYVAEGWLYKAERLLAGSENMVELTEARLALAGVEHQVGHWARARQRYAALKKSTVIQKSPYRWAKVQLREGRANLAEGRSGLAIAQLSESAETFRSFQNWASVGQAYYLLGQAYAAQDNPEKAGETFLACAEVFETIHDSLALTRAIWSMEQLVESFRISTRLSDRIRIMVERIPSRHAITRFPEQILWLYRILALVIALPLTCVLVYMVGSSSSIAVSFVEITLLVFSRGMEQSVLLVLLVIGPLLMAVMFSFWIYRGIYSLFGLFTVYILGNLLVPIERQQPTHIAIDSIGITKYSSQVVREEIRGHDSPEVHGEEQVQVQKMAWDLITDAVSDNYQAISRPIGLISRTLLCAGTEVLSIEGVTSGYRFLIRDIQSALASRAVPLKLRVKTFTFLEIKSILIAFLGVFPFVVSFVLYLYNIGQIEIYGFLPNSDIAIPLPVSTLVDFTFSALMPVLLAVMLWRLFVHILRLRKILGPQFTTIPPLAILSAAILSTAISVGFLLYLALTK
jgi:hypothetical protein